MGLQAIKEDARARVHAAFSLPADLFTPGSVDPHPLPSGVRIMVPKISTEAGDLDSEGFVTRAEQNRLMRFWLADFAGDPTALRSGSRVVLTGSGEEYKIARCLPPYGQTQDAEVYRV